MTIYRSSQFGIQQGVDQSALFQQLLDTGAGREVVIEPGNYIANLLLVRSGTRLILERGVTITGRGDGSARVLQVSSVNNIIITGYGAEIILPDEDISHTLYISSAKDIQVEGLKVKGPGGADIHESDAIYISGDPNTNNVSEGIQFRHVEAYNARRNILSVVAGRGILIEDCHFHSTTEGTHNKGIDLEGNRWMESGQSPVQDVTIRRCHIHDTHSDGILHSFADGAKVEDCNIHDVGGRQVHIGPSVAAFDFAKRVRPGDVLGVSSIDPATGWIEVLSSGALIDDYNITVGTVVSLASRGGTWPTELAFGYGFVSEVSADQKSIRVAKNPEFDQVNSTTGSGSGCLNGDPETSDLWIAVFRDGNGSGLTVSNLKGHSAASGGIHCSVARNIKIRDCVVPDGISAMITSDFQATDNEVQGAGRGMHGIQLSRVHKPHTARNKINNTAKRGMNVEGVSRARFEADEITNCGTAQDAAIKLVNVRHAHLSPIISNELSHVTPRGIMMHATTEGCLIDGAIVQCAGINDGAAISDVGTNNRIVNCIVNSGAWEG